jgi:hypothetical protein
MTDSSSNDTEAIADMASELIAAKIETAKKDTQMTHVMRVGTFHMEIVPDRDISIQEIFNNTLDKLMEKYGDKLLEINIQQMKADGDSSRHYG